MIITILSKNKPPTLDFQTTVKPVYNAHPWDSKKVAVVQKVVVSCMLLLSKLGIRLAAVNRWLLTQV